MNKLIIRDSGSPNEGIPETTYEIQTPFNFTELKEQDEIKMVRLFQIQIEKVYEEFSIGTISSIWDFELKKMVEDSTETEEEMEK